MTPARKPVPKPSRGEIWSADLDPVKGHEQGGPRPVLIIADDMLNHSPAERTIILPLTSKGGDRPFRVPVTPPVGGLTMQSWILCDQIRSISTERLSSFYGTITPEVLLEVQEQLLVVLDL